MAIEFLGRKVSGTSGDARKALDICKLAIDMAEAQAKKSGYGFGIKKLGTGAAREACPTN